VEAVRRSLTCREAPEHGTHPQEQREEAAVRDPRGRALVVVVVVALGVVVRGGRHAQRAQPHRHRQQPARPRALGHAHACARARAVQEYGEG
jgi:hypothetical protein